MSPASAQLRRCRRTSVDDDRLVQDARNERCVAVTCVVSPVCSRFARDRADRSPIRLTLWPRLKHQANCPLLNLCECLLCRPMAPLSQHLEPPGSGAVQCRAHLLPWTDGDRVASAERGPAVRRRSSSFSITRTKFPCMGRAASARDPTTRPSFWSRC
jgi:hypothetical protein